MLCRHSLPILELWPGQQALSRVQVYALQRGRVNVVERWLDVLIRASSVSFSLLGYEVFLFAFYAAVALHRIFSYYGFVEK